MKLNISPKVVSGGYFHDIEQLSEPCRLHVSIAYLIRTVYASIRIVYYRFQEHPRGRNRES